MAYRFNPPPGWPQPPQGWRPPEGWQPDPSWPAAPEGWEFWVAEPAASAGSDVVGSGADAPEGQGATAEAPPESPAVEQAPAAPALDGGAAEADAAEAGQGAGAGHGEPGSDATETGQQAPSEGPTEEPGDQPTEQFPAPTPTEQLSAQQPEPGWGGVPQQPVGHGPEGSQAPAPQGPGVSAPGQPQWGTAPAAQNQPPGGYQQPGPAHSGGYQQPGLSQAGGFGPVGLPQQDGAQHAGGYPGAPVPGSGPQFGGPSTSQAAQQSAPFGPGDASGKPNRTPLIVGGIAGVVILALLIVIGVRLIGGGDDQPEGAPTPSASAPGTTDPTDVPTTTDPTDAPTTTDPTDDPTDQQTGQQATGDTVLLAPGEAAEILGVTGEPEVTVALMSVERNWEPEGAQSAICPDPTGEYIALEFEFTTLPALADGSETYSFVGFELGLANADGTGLDVSAVSGLFCLSQDQQAPADVGPGETFTGWAVVDAPSEATMVTWAPFLDFSGKQPTYAWNLADF